MNILAVGAGGFVGATFRYLIGLIPVREGTLFPIKTFLINLIGCALIGLISTRVENDTAILFLKVGFCGGFTTFSTFALESTDLIRSGHAWLAVLYMVLSAVTGIAVIAMVEGK